MKKVSRSWWNLLVPGLVVALGGCAQTVVQPKYEPQIAGPVLRPSRVFVYDFAITAANVSENQGFFAGVYNN